MTNLFIAYVAALFVPLLFHSWRVAVLGLGAQGFLLALVLLATHEWSWEAAFEFGSLLLIRGIFVPWYLFRQMRGFDLPADFSPIAKNLWQWLFAFTLLIAAYVLGNRVAPYKSQEALQVGAATAGILIGMLVLSHQIHPVGQLIGLFTFEGGVALLELISPHLMPFPVRIGVSLASVILVITCGQYLRRLLALPLGAEDVEEEAL